MRAPRSVACWTAARSRGSSDVVLSETLMIVGALVGRVRDAAGQGLDADLAVLLALLVGDDLDGEDPGVAREADDP